jgi:hypothetical protein
MTFYQDKQMKHFVLGTDGQVDHRKTALIKALTGIDTNRLKESGNNFPFARAAKAIELLHKANIMLICYVRNGRMNIYSHERRIII